MIVSLTIGIMVACVHVFSVCDHNIVIILHYHICFFWLYIIYIYHYATLDALSYGIVLQYIKLYVHILYNASFQLFWTQTATLFAEDPKGAPFVAQIFHSLAMAVAHAPG